MNNIRLNAPETLDAEGWLSSPKSLKHDALEMSEKSLVEIFPRIYPPHRKIAATRCFPEGCGRKAMEASKRVSQKAIACKDNGLENPLSFTKGMPFDETIKRHIHKEEEILQNTPRVCPPQRRISATRHFPEGCGGRAVQASNKVSQEAIASEDNGSEHPRSSAKHMSGKIKSHTDKNKDLLQVMPRVYPPPRRIWANRCFPEGFGRKALQSTEEVEQECIACITKGSVSQCGSWNQSQEKVPIILALPVYTMTVGSRGVPKYSWRQGKETPKKAARGIGGVKTQI